MHSDCGPWTVDCGLSDRGLRTADNGQRTTDNGQRTTDNGQRTKQMTVDQILTALHDVKDPEIPTISLVELGVITAVELSDDGAVRILMTPTFVGCPAM